MFKLLRKWRRQRIIKRSTISSSSWDNALQQLPLLDHLSEEERNRLRRLAILFLHEKSFVGAQDLELTGIRDGQPSLSIRPALHRKGK